MRAVRHLLYLLGRCERIGLLTGPESSHSGKLRLSGYCRPPDARLTSLYPTLFTRRNRRLQRGRGACSGTYRFFCYNDLVAMGVLRACSELGVAVPTDLTLVDCDDIRMASLTSPTLTMLSIDEGAFGRRTGQLRVSSMATDVKPNCMPVMRKPTLIVRGSAP